MEKKRDLLQKQRQYRENKVTYLVFSLFALFLKKRERFLRETARTE